MDDAARMICLADAAAGEVETGMTLGLGTGSTAEAVLRALGRRVAGGLEIRGVATSRRTAALAEELAIPLVSLEEVERIDLGIDGADEIDPRLDVVKGRGGALLHEKLVALACDDYLIVASSEKLVATLGSRVPIPVEVVPFGRQQTASRLRRLGFEPQLRTSGGPEGDAPGAETPVVSDGGHVIYDCAIGAMVDVHGLAAATKAITGVVDHGLFLGVARSALVVESDGSVRRLVAPSGPNLGRR
ncbi:MAG: Ribose 5-phosphate isomerase A [uncultured Thermomicrobiales bacterium]|uniref:Ribose-5-phosphate isomerase A n=1 Tax=uncultured Thermomicrobiales bacterium TaxID=1645740 RepID=A0A6J4UAQ2_9BACT|nr:MAG: Ribose 5-phosphate isomerase A [uncultured Thermomicrobiales bacterium]